MDNKIDYKIKTGYDAMDFDKITDMLKDVYQWLLITKDAHGVYQKFGFNAVDRPKDWMEIRYNRPAR